MMMPNDLVADESNLFSVQNDANKPTNITTQDLRKYFGVSRSRRNCFIHILHFVFQGYTWLQKIPYNIFIM